MISYLLPLLAAHCPGDCSGHGRCFGGNCLCSPGWWGEACAVRACPRSCSQRGSCTPGPSGRYCQCYPGWAGPDCSERACPNGCSARGACVNGTCVCEQGFSG